MDKTSQAFTQIVKLINEPIHNAATISNASIVLINWRCKFSVEGFVMTEQLAWGLIDTIQRASKLTQLNQQ